MTREIVGERMVSEVELERTVANAFLNSEAGRAIALTAARNLGIRADAKLTELRFQLAFAYAQGYAARGKAALRAQLELDARLAGEVGR